MALTTQGNKINFDENIVEEQIAKKLRSCAIIVTRGI